MPFKPMKKRDYLRWIGKYGWTLKKGSVDWKLVSAEGKVQVPCIVITHPGDEVTAICVKKTKAALKAAGLE